MNMKVVLLVCFVIFIEGCSSKKEQLDSKNYFLPGELSRDLFTDSSLNNIFTSELKKLQQPDIHKSKNPYYRITFLSPINGSYAVSVYNTDEVNNVNFSWEGDRGDGIKSGIKNLSFNYVGNGSHFLQLLNHLNQVVDEDSIFFEIPPSESGGDGILFLFECSKNGKYQAIVRSEPELRHVDRDSISFYKVVRAMNVFIPLDILPKEEDEIKTDDDLLFSIY